jgi:hypothetical protein
MKFKDEKIKYLSGRLDKIRRIICQKQEHLISDADAIELILKVLRDED